MKPKIKINLDKLKIKQIKGAGRSGETSVLWSSANYKWSDASAIWGGIDTNISLSPVLSVVENKTLPFSKVKLQSLKLDEINFCMPNLKKIEY